MSVFLLPHFIFANSDMEVIWNPGDSNMIILRVRQRSISRREEGESLYEADSEEQHLVPSQSLAHTLPLAYTEGHQGGMFFIPGNI